MTMVLVKENEVKEVGLPNELRALSLMEIKAQGWVPLVGTEKPTDPVALGYQYVYGAPFVVEDGVATGTWSVEQRPQPYPSWNWVDGGGWVPPVPYPTDGKSYDWNEGTLTWLLSDED